MEEKNDIKNPPESIPNQTSKKPFSKSFYILISIILIAVVAGIAIAGNYYIKQYQLSNYHAPMNIIPTIQFTSPTPTLAWKTIALGKASFKIPSSWYYDTYTYSQPESYNFVRIYRYARDPNDGPHQPTPLFTFDFYETADPSGKQQELSRDISEKRIVTISGITGQYYVSKRIELIYYDNSGENPMRETEGLFLQRPEGLYNLINNYKYLDPDCKSKNEPNTPFISCNKDFNQILSTFKFTDQAKIVAPSKIISTNNTSPDKSFVVTENILGDYNTITVKDKAGKIIVDDLIAKNSKEIGYNVKFYCMCGTSFKGWINNSLFAIKIENGNDEEYEYLVNATTGKVDESTFKRVK